MQYSSLVLVLAAFASVRSTFIDLNSRVDEAFVKANEILRKQGKTTARYPSGIINANVSYSENYFIGLDSLTRTGNSSVEIQGSLLKFNFHYGLKMWVQAFRSMKIYGEDMSVVFRIRDNSIHLGFTLHNNTNCSVTLDDIQYEKLTNVEFSASRPKYDGIDVNEFFQKDVRGVFNKAIDSTKKQIEKGLQYVCKYIPHEEPEQLSSLPVVMLDHLTGFYSMEEVAMK